MGNQQVSLVLTKQFVDKLVKVKSKHLLIGYYRVVTVSQNSINTKDTRTRKLQRLSRKGVDAK